MVIDTSTAVLAGNPAPSMVRVDPIATEAGAARVLVAAAAGTTATDRTPLNKNAEVINDRIRLPSIDAVPPPQAVRRGHVPDDDRARPTFA
jgi:hypothetical protein